MSLKIQVTNKVAVNMTPENFIVCGNSGYVVEFLFDEEWQSKSVKTARFVYRKGGKNYFEDVVFTGNTANVPVLSNIEYVLVGVYAGDLITTTPAVVECSKSILCGSGKNKEPQTDVYNQLLELLNDGLFSPIVSVSEITGGHRITVTDLEGEKTFDVMDGKNGLDGDDGQDGQDGDDGGYYVPTVSASGDLSWTPKKADMPEVPDVNIKGEQGKTAYSYAQDGGYTGTEEEFAALLAGAMAMDLLWENASPDSEFPVQTLDIPTTQYRMFWIEARYKTGKLPAGSTIVRYGQAGLLSMYNGANYYRIFNPNSSGMNVKSGWKYSTSETEDNTVVIPTRIYGIKLGG